MPKSKKNQPKTTKALAKKAQSNIPSYARRDSGRRLLKREKIEILECFYLKGMNYGQISKHCDVNRETVRGLIISIETNQSELTPIKRELLARKNQLLDEIIAKAGQQALDTVGKASFRDSMVGLGIASDHRYGKPDKKAGIDNRKQVVINYPHWQED